jgi:hypothetical protein
MLADIAAGDLRPITYWSRRSPPPPSSPALGAGKWFDIRDIAESGTLVNITDFTGAPLNLIGGNPTIGAYQWPKSVKELLGLSIFVR